MWSRSRWRRSTATARSTSPSASPRSCIATASSRPLSGAGGTELDDRFATYDALAVGELIRTRELGAREVLGTTMASLRKANQRLNAVTDLYEDARPPADGPLQ